jgi:putative tricarboxylic transport membrane protein
MATLLSTRLLFLLGLTLLAAAYTVMAFGMQWQVEAGQIGPGFFPRIVGVATLLGCAVAIARAVLGARASRHPTGGDETKTGGESRRTDPAVTALSVGCMVLFYLVFEPLGALLSSVLFLGLMLALVNRGRHRVNAVVSVLVPVGLYLLFEVLLETGLPPGLVLPL